jgi:peptidoglycan/LPS O-acetylase OafA/YrhL
MPTNSNPPTAAGARFAAAPPIPERASHAAPAAAAVAAARLPAEKARRLWELDFTKGSLVLLMVVYHWWDTFISHWGPIFLFLRFLTPSFICISGFIVSGVYFSKYGADRGAMARRLVVRGLKLLGVFVALNAARVGVSDIWLHLPIGRLDARTLAGIWLTGHGVGGGNDKVAAFGILVPIGYLLIALAPLVLAKRLGRKPIAVALAVCWAGVVGLGLAGTYSYTLELLAIGLLGGVLGAIPTDRIDRFVAKGWPAIVAAYAAYAAAITVWGVPYILQVVGVPLSLLLIYALARLVRNWRPSDPIAFFGRYSLVGYIVQIGALQVLAHFWNRPGLGPAGLVATFVAAALGTYIAVWITDRLRIASPFVDRLYRAVFA